MDEKLKLSYLFIFSQNICTAWSILLQKWPMKTSPLVNGKFSDSGFFGTHQAIPQISRPVWYKDVYIGALSVPSVRYFMLK